MEEITCSVYDIENAPKFVIKYFKDIFYFFLINLEPRNIYMYDSDVNRFFFCTSTIYKNCIPAVFPKQ